MLNLPLARAFALVPLVEEKAGESMEAVFDAVARIVQQVVEEIPIPERVLKFAFTEPQGGIVGVTLGP